MTDYEQIFLSSGQEKQKLTIALKRFVETEDPDWKSRYQSYLRTRFRPAMTELIHDGDLARIRSSAGKTSKFRNMNKRLHLTDLHDALPLIMKNFQPCHKYYEFASFIC